MAGLGGERPFWKCEVRRVKFERLRSGAHAGETVIAKARRAPFTLRTSHFELPQEAVHTAGRHNEQ